MTFKRRVLDALTREQLLDIGCGLELDVTTSMRRDDILDVVSRSKRAKLDAVLDGLSRDTLKVICEALGVSSDGREKQPIVDAYTHAEAKSPMRPEVGTQAQFRTHT